MASERARMLGASNRMPLRNHMSVRALRKRFPKWEWRAERYGFGWEYIGVQLWEEVRVYACSVMSGEDVFETQWRVDNGVDSVDFATWSMTHDE